MTVGLPVLRSWIRDPAVSLGSGRVQTEETPSRGDSRGNYAALESGQEPRNGGLEAEADDFRRGGEKPRVSLTVLP